MISIRRIRMGEADLFRRIRLTALRESPAAFGTSLESALARSPESWTQQADGTARGVDRSTFLAFDDGAPIGIAALYRTGVGVGEMMQVWVAPDYRSRGVARDVVEAVLRWAGENGFHSVRATLAKQNTRALRFYRRCGFEPIEAAPPSGGPTIVVSRRIEPTGTPAASGGRAR